MIRLFLFPLLIALSTAAYAQTTTLYWDTNGTTAGTSPTSTANWNGTSDWNTDSTGNLAPGAWVSGDDAYFSAGSNGTGTQAVTVNGTVAANGITIENGALTLGGSSTPALSIGTDGVTIANTASGTSSFASTLGTITLSGSQAWDNNSSVSFNVAAGLTSTASILTFDGTGNGATTISGAIGGGTSLVQESTASQLNLTVANTFTGSLTINGGTVNAGSENAVGANGNTIDLSNGGTLTYTPSLVGSGTTFNHNVVATTTTGGTLNFSDDTVVEGSFTATVLTLSAGDDLIETSGNQNITTLDLVGDGTITTGYRAIVGFDSAGQGFISGATINVSNAYTLDFGSGGIYANVINLLSGTALENRDGNTTLSGVVLPTTGTLTLGSDDVGGGSITIQDGDAISGSLTLNINGHSGTADSTPVHLTGVISGSGITLTLNPGATAGSYLYLGGTSANTYSGSTVINNLTVDPTGTAFGSSAVTLNGATVNLQNGDYAGTDNTNEFILGTGTNLINGANSITTFSGYVVNGAGTVLHLTGPNNTIDPSATAISDYSTLDLDSGRTFLMKYGLNFIAAGSNNGGLGTAVNVATGATLDFDIGTTFASANAFAFSTGSGLTLRDDQGGTTNATLSNVTLPTAGTFTIGSDDEGNEGGSITISSGLILTGNLTIDANDSSGSTVVSTLGNISGAGGLTVSAGGNGPGILHLTGTNNYSGSTTVTAALLDIKGNDTAAGTAYNAQGGTLDIGSGGSISSSAVVTIGNGTSSGLFELGDSGGAVSQTIASLTTSGTGAANAVVGGNSSVSTLTVNNSSADTYAGVIGGTAASQNNIALVKSGLGTLSLSGKNTYTGGTTVSAGKLAIDGSIAGNASVALGAELGGSGSIGGTISGAGAVGPGDSPGILTASAVNPTAATSFNFEFTLAGGPAYNSASASLNDVLHLEGATPFTAALTSANVINLYFATGNTTYEGGFFIDSSTNTLAADVANATFNYYVEDATGSVSYNGETYELVHGTETTVAVNGAAFGDGTESGYTEEFFAPEPSTYALFLLGALAILVVRRRFASRSWTAARPTAQRIR